MRRIFSVNLLFLAILAISASAGADDKDCNTYISQIGLDNDQVRIDYRNIEQVPMDRQLLVLTVKIKNSWATENHFSTVYFVASGKVARYDQYIEMNHPWAFNNHGGGGYGGWGNGYEHYPYERMYENQDFETFFRNYRDELYVTDQQYVVRGEAEPTWGSAEKNKPEAYREYVFRIPVEAYGPVVRRGSTTLRYDKNILLKAMWGGSFVMLDSKEEQITDLIPRLDHERVKALSAMMIDRQPEEKKVGLIANRFEMKFWVLDEPIVRMVKNGGGLVGKHSMRLDDIPRPIQPSSVREFFSLYLNPMNCGTKVLEPPKPANDLKQPDALKKALEKLAKEKKKAELQDE